MVLWSIKKYIFFAFVPGKTHVVEWERSDLWKKSISPWEGRYSWDQLNTLPCLLLSHPLNGRDFPCCHEEEPTSDVLTFFYPGCHIPFLSSMWWNATDCLHWFIVLSVCYLWCWLRTSLCMEAKEAQWSSEWLVLHLRLWQLSHIALTMQESKFFIGDFGEDGGSTRLNQSTNSILPLGTPVSKNHTGTWMGHMPPPRSTPTTSGNHVFSPQNHRNFTPKTQESPLLNLCPPPKFHSSPHM